MKHAEANAKQDRIILGKLSKSELIELIQACEGNADCYASAFAGECDQGGCGWCEDCFDVARSGDASVA
jgi:hypothetical protein